MTRQEAETILQRTFKLPKFYDEQWLTIDKILKGEKVLLIEKTGFGKSLCFQFPATVFNGTTVIFSPLIALMRDQVKKLTALGISAKCINSEQTSEENTQIINEAKQGKIKILYIAPERQENSEWIEATRQMNLSMVVVDEAHCISVWGHDFRPTFKRIINLVKLLPKGLPVLATTATATKRVELDVAQQIGNNISTIRGNLMRDNFKLFVVKVSSEDEKLIWLGKNLNNLPGSGILYTGTRVDTEIYSKWFENLKISSTAYNAGLDADSRIAIENGLMSNKWKCIISTNALGMGIDKPDIRFIIHTQIPQSPIHYYQEIGRAGRDGQPSYIILFYNPEDRKLPEAFIEGGRPAIKKYERVINAVKSELLGERDLMKRTNLKQNQIRVIKADLIEQGIIREVMIGKSKKFEFVPNSQPLNTEAFEELRNAKLADLENMIAYVETDKSRMKFLCDYLGDNSNHTFNNCDNTGEKKITVSVTSEWTKKLQNFREDYFPELEVESKGLNIVNGVAASYYGVSNVGAALHRSKYEKGGDFPDFLLKLVLKAYRKKFGQEKFDLILYVPPTSSGDLVRNFAVKISQVLKFPISHNLVKVRQTKEQKVFENGYLKTDNVRGAFTFSTPNDIKGKSVLLIDDIFDSGATVKEIGRVLTNFGAVKIAPIVIARTVGGDIV
ncbi:Superfamily II DNA helicase [Ignavibacterium album JCM 16511]|uniref:DNA 3'-5' helicase n=1 Tax=Ignavibacterium album (strain DSM 19864 / JCM 16511 / NBRC 101810 / Mat9-16) TaxID=945713 RepID=I0AFM5_IGNAJ|nr:RecQ family ATP-dependent DNA helicase [Ignavibacterium album]AFH47782.1 Superfamily II DNA helicase [Ignavibacterium album JCM 16511]